MKSEECFEPRYTEGSLPERFDSWITQVLENLIYTEVRSYKRRKMRQPEFTTDNIDEIASYDPNKDEELKEILFGNTPLILRNPKDFLFVIGGLALIFAGIWLFIKLIFHPILFELDLRNQGKKGISYIVTSIQLAGIIAMYVYYNERNQGGVDAAIGFTAIAFVVAAVFASKRAKELLLSKKEKWLLILAQIFLPVTIIVIILLAGLLFDKIGKMLSGDSDHDD